jgi:hypothetical protein
MCVLGSGDDQPTDGKGKGRPSARRMWLGRLTNPPTAPTPGAGAFCKLCKHFKASRAVASNCLGSLHHDDARRRPARPARAHPARQPWRQAPTDLRRRGDAGREEGGPCRQQLPFEPGPQPVALRTRPARGGLDSIALERSPRGDESARRASPGSAVPLGAATQACQIASKSDPFSLARATPSEGAKTGVAEPHIAEQSRSWRGSAKKDRQAIFRHPNGDIPLYFSALALKKDRHCVLGP